MFEGLVGVGTCIFGAAILLGIGVLFRGIRLLYEYERGGVF